MKNNKLLNLRLFIFILLPMMAFLVLVFMDVEAFKPYANVAYLIIIFLLVPSAIVWMIETCRYQKQKQINKK